ncbi:MAG: putative MarR-family transcriptional regulator [Rhodoglobus sp.]|nr:putative MarR-family transcriptional regulator [Rhodoglobus sp.]
MAADPTLSAAQRTAWIRFAIVAHGIPAELNSRLLADAGISQFEYLVLNHLNLSEGRAMPMTRLAVLMASSLSRLSHVVSRLESDGRVARSRSADDGRVAIATLTDRGLELFQAAAPGYVASVHELFFARLDAADLADLDRVMAKVLPGVDAGGILAPLARDRGASRAPRPADR